MGAPSGCRSNSPRGGGGRGRPPRTGSPPPDSPSPPPDAPAHRAAALERARAAPGCSRQTAPRLAAPHRPRAAPPPPRRAHPPASSPPLRVRHDAQHPRRGEHLPGLGRLPPALRRQAEAHRRHHDVQDGQRHQPPVPTLIGRTGPLPLPEPREPQDHGQPTDRDDPRHQRPDEGLPDPLLGASRGGAGGGTGGTSVGKSTVMGAVVPAHRAHRPGLSPSRPAAAAGTSSPARACCARRSIPPSAG